MDNQISSALRSIKLLAIANACWIAPGLIPDMFWEYTLVTVVNWFATLAAFLLMILSAVVASKTIVLPNKASALEEAAYHAPIGGIAISCLISVAIVIALAARNDDLLLSVAIWFLYIIFAGLSINTHSDTKISKVVVYSIYPSATLLIGAFSLLAFVYILGAGDLISGAIGSSSYVLSNDQELTKLTIAYLLMSFLSVPAISAACLARTRLIELYGKSKSITVEELEQLQKKINIVAAIIVFILGVILAV